MLKHFEYESIHYWQTARDYFGKNLYITGFYFLDGVLIDCGPTNSLPQLVRLFDDFPPIKQILVSHHHEDHTGNLKYLCEKKGVPAFAHPFAERNLQTVSREIPFYRKVVWGRPRPIAIENVPGEIQTTAHLLRVIETPGHSEDHLCFFEPERKWLFTGDLYLSSYLRYLRADENIYEIMRSVQKMIDLKPLVLFCNHRGPVENAIEALQKKLGFLEGLRDEVLDCLCKGDSLDRVKRNFRSDFFYRWFSAGELCTSNLIDSFVKHDHS